MNLTHHTPLREISHEQVCVIDMDTGTVLNTNLKVVPADLVSDDVTESDAEAFALAADHGDELYVSDDFLAALDS